MNLKIKVSKVLPLGNYKAITLYPFIFIKKSYYDKYYGTRGYNRLINHESIHGKQIEELGVLKFYILYIAYFLRLWIFTKRKWDEAYRAIPFEVEAYKFDQDLTYLSNREPFKWREYKHV